MPNYTKRHTKHSAKRWRYVCMSDLVSLIWRKRRTRSVMNVLRYEFNRATGFCFGEIIFRCFRGVLRQTQRTPLCDVLWLCTDLWKRSCRPESWLNILQTKPVIYIYVNIHSENPSNDLLGGGRVQQQRALIFEREREKNTKWCCTRIMTHN